MAIYSRKNLIINANGPDPLLVQPLTNGEILVYDASLGSFINGSQIGSGGAVETHNQGAGVPVLDDQIGNDIYFNTLVNGDYIDIEENDGEITISAKPAAKVVADITARDALIPDLIIGSQVFVIDAGFGENAFYIWNGTEFILFATQDSARTDAYTYAKFITHTSDDKVLLGTITKGRNVISVSVNVIEAFNGASPELTIGDDINGESVIMTSDLSDLSVVDEYQSLNNYLYKNEGETPMYVYLNFGGSTSGKVKVVVTYA